MANLYKSTDTSFVDGEKKGRLRHLDGLRGLAILLVLTGHFFEEVDLFKIGWIGVNLFFILSGYLITGRLFYYDQPGKPHYFRNFYMRRILRIFPLYYGCLVIFFLVLPVFYPKYDTYFGELHRDQLWYWTYLSNWRVIYKYPINITIVTFWSLAVEEQFYLFWPFLFRYVKEKGLKAIIFALIFLSIIGRLLTPGHFLAYYSTLTACEPLLGGALVCIWEKEGRLAGYYKYFLWAFFLSMAGFLVVFKYDSVFLNFGARMIAYGYTAVDGCMLFLLVACITPGRGAEVLRRLFSARWIVWLGNYSYGIYVFHFIILMTLVFKVERVFVQRGINALPAYLLSRFAGIGLVLLMSYASFRWYERPFLRLKKYFD